MATIIITDGVTTSTLATQGNYPLTAKGLIDAKQICNYIDNVVYDDEDSARAALGVLPDRDAILEPVLSGKYAAVVYDLTCPDSGQYLTAEQVRDGVRHLELGSSWAEVR